MSEEQTDDLNKQIELAIAQLDRQFGKGSVMRLDDEPMKWASIPTGAINLDLALGIGGLPQGRICEVFGPESSGKSTLCLHVIANAQKMGKICMFIDAEHALDPIYAKALGVKLSDLLLSQPGSGEEAIDIAELMIKTGALRDGVCVIDSVAALVPKAELDGDMDASHMGLQPRLMAKAMRRLVPLAAETNTLILFTNQIREKIGIMFGCLHADTLVNFVDGRSISIRQVVDNKIEGEVWSYNEETTAIEPRPIVDWHYNGNVESASDYIHIETEALDGRSSITVTPDHECLTPKGWKQAKDLGVGDRLISKYRPARIVSVREASNEQMEQKGKYDISVEGNHNYMAGGSANGLIVHNSPETQPGGRALKFAASVRIDLRRIESIQDKAGEDVIGNRVKAKVIKNKMAPPLRVVEFNIMYGRGVDYLRCILDLGTDYEVVKKSGSWYSYEGTQLGQGPKNATEHLASDMEMTREIERKIYERV